MVRKKNQRTNDAMQTGKDIFEKTNTMSILREMLFQGKIITFKDGSRVGLSEDMTLGFVAKLNGEDIISHMSEITIRQLYQMLIKETST